MALLSSSDKRLSNPGICDKSQELNSPAVDNINNNLIFFIALPHNSDSRESPRSISGSHGGVNGIENADLRETTPFGAESRTGKNLEESLSKSPCALHTDQVHCDQIANQQAFLVTFFGCVGLPAAYSGLHPSPPSLYRSPHHSGVGSRLFVLIVDVPP